MLIFSLEVHKCFSFRNIKKIANIFLVFDYKLLVCKKPNDLLMQHIDNKSSEKKEFYFTINLLYPREESLQFFS
jgi:hypothetical protein